MKFIKHENSMDVCYEIFASDGNDYYCYAWNMGQVTASQINHECIKIPVNKIYLDKGWQVCKNYKEILDSNKSFKDGMWKYLQERSA